MKIGIIHATCNAVPPLNNAFKESITDVTILNFVDEHIQYYANQIGDIDEKIYKDFLNLAIKAEEANVDVIIVACTVLTPIVSSVESFITKPIIAVDAPMLNKAVNNFKKIGVVVTNAPTGPATRRQLEKLAKEVNKEIEVDIEVNTKAMDELKSGNIEEHNKLNAFSAKKLKDRGNEVILLAQITQASAEKEVEKLGVPILTSPKETVNVVLNINK